MCCYPSPSVEQREISVTTLHGKCRLLRFVPCQLSAAVQLSIHRAASLLLCETLGSGRVCEPGSQPASQPDTGNQATAAKTSVLQTTLVP